MHSRVFSRGVKMQELSYRNYFSRPVRSSNCGLFMTLLGAAIQYKSTRYLLRSFEPVFLMIYVKLDML